MRQLFVPSIALFTILFLSGCNAPTPPPAVPSRPPVRRVASPTPEIVWKFKVKGGAFDATPCADGDTVYVGDFDGSLYALNLATGEQTWCFQNDAAFAARCACRDDSLFVGDTDGKFFCLDKGTGELLWQFDTTDMITSRATFYRNRVIVPTQRGEVLCLHAGSGELLWQFSAIDEVHAPVTVIDEFGIVVASCSSKLQVINLRTGKHFQDIDLPGETMGPLALERDVVFAATMRGKAVCLDWRQATQVWTAQLDEAGSLETRGGITLGNQLVVFGSDDRHVRALDAVSGELLWKFRAKGPISSQVMIRDERIIFTTTRGEIYALNARDGSKVWFKDLGGDFTGAPTLSGRYVIAANGNGTVYCLRELPRE